MKADALPPESTCAAVKTSSKTAIELLSLPGTQGGDAADHAYRRIIQRIGAAERSLEIFLYVWRADAVGHLIGRAVWEAAERGVRVTIFKDSGAVLFESQESNRKSFFPARRSVGQRIQQRIAGLTFPDSRVEDDWTDELGRDLRGHPNVDFRWVSATHTKYYCIDERFLITGSLNLEDRHRDYHDVMVEITGEEAVRRFRDSEKTGRAEGEGMAILRNDPVADRFTIKPEILRLIENAREALHIEMAYLGDDKVTEALVAADSRGVAITLLFSRKANIGNDVNYAVLVDLMERSGIRVRLSDKMIHSKVMVVDGRRVLLGSANFSVFSLERAGELNLLVEENPVFVDRLSTILAERWDLGEAVESIEALPPYSRLLAALQQWHQRRSQHR